MRDPGEFIYQPIGIFFSESYFLIGFIPEQPLSVRLNPSKKAGRYR
jgi:hypothetical protein